jgi:hypothetical protein
MCQRSECPTSYITDTLAGHLEIIITLLPVTHLVNVLLNIRHLHTLCNLVILRVYCQIFSVMGYGIVGWNIRPVLVPAGQCAGDPSQLCNSHGPVTERPDPNTSTVLNSRIRTDSRSHSRSSSSRRYAESVHTTLG